MPPRPPVLRAALRSGLLALVATLVTATVIASGVAASPGTAAQASAGTEARSSSSLGPVDARLGRRACGLLGRAWVEEGCSRTVCRRGVDTARVNANAEMCSTPSGAFYARAIDVRVCRALHRPWIAEVNLCASHPARAAGVVTRASQCVGSASDYLVLRESQARWDECVTPSRRRELERIAAKAGQPLRVVALQRSRTLCALRDHTVYVDGVCRSTGAGAPQGAPTGTLLVGDSISWRGNDELARLRPRWVLDALPGRRVTQLSVRVRAYLAAHVAPSTLVLALGTNPATSWTKQDYVDATALVPEDTRVLLVTPYRAPEANDARAVSQIDTYDRWLREIASARPHTCLADWRGLAVDRPEVLIDGTHQTPDGEGAWAQLITASWDACQTG